MKYQLVIQFSEELYGELDWIAYMEDRLDESLVDAEIDGHDIGNGEVNIFINTNRPVETFILIKDILEQEKINLEHVKIAYREFSNDNYISLWPDHVSDFNIT